MNSAEARAQPRLMGGLSDSNEQWREDLEWEARAKVLRDLAAPAGFGSAEILFG